MEFLFDTVSYPFPWRSKWQPTPVFLPGESHGRRSLVGYSPRVTKSRTRLSDFTFTFTLEFNLLHQISLNPFGMKFLKFTSIMEDFLTTPSILISVTLLSEGATHCLEGKI